MTSPRVRQFLLFTIAFLPLALIAVLVQVFEPPPGGWLATGNPHYWANLLRAFGFFAGGAVLGLVSYTLARSLDAEGRVTDGHPRRTLYRHVTAIAAGHGLLVASTLFYIRDRIDAPLSPATPLVLFALALTVYALLQMIRYQEQRLARFMNVRRTLGTVVAKEGKHCLVPVGATDSVSLDEMLEHFDEGTVLHVTIERAVDR